METKDFSASQREGIKPMPFSFMTGAEAAKMVEQAKRENGESAITPVESREDRPISEKKETPVQSKPYISSNNDPEFQKQEKFKFSFYLRKDYADALKRYAEDEGMSVNMILTREVVKMLKRGR